ncbi:unnamed protein product [Blepharisma stoltei]|uniref:Uncharacterized protein n=1 Tax=Blepharisma stoltei TaxID=1481888 RepID=A0AAU9IFG5_9CILI|nr:unnamed protein product [Blepharisma stoltei]
MAPDPNYNQRSNLGSVFRTLAAISKAKSKAMALDNFVKAERIEKQSKIETSLIKIKREIFQLNLSRLKQRSNTREKIENDRDKTENIKLKVIEIRESLGSFLINEEYKKKFDKELDLCEQVLNGIDLGRKELMNFLTYGK